MTSRIIYRKIATEPYVRQRLKMKQMVYFTFLYLYNSSPLSFKKITLKALPVTEQIVNPSDESENLVYVPFVALRAN